MHGMRALVASKRARLCVGVVVAFLAFAAAPAGASTASFAGVWRATDPDDGSTLVLAISPGNRVLFVDLNATACGGGLAFAFGGPGVVSDDTLTATVDIFCGVTPFAQDVEFSIKREGETLVGPGGEVYTRVLGR